MFDESSKPKLPVPRKARSVLRHEQASLGTWASSVLKFGGPNCQRIPFGSKKWSGPKIDKQTWGALSMGRTERTDAKDFVFGGYPFWGWLKSKTDVNGQAILCLFKVASWFLLFSWGDPFSSFRRTKQENPDKPKKIRAGVAGPGSAPPAAGPKPTRRKGCRSAYRDAPARGGPSSGPNNTQNRAPVQKSRSKWLFFFC